MQTKDKTGIICDFCALMNREEFLYYSLDFKKVEIFNDSYTGLEYILRLPTHLSYDICSICFDEIKINVINNNANIQRGIFCELSGVLLHGTFIYYYCLVSKVDVKLSGQTSFCVECKSIASDKTQKCKKCGCAKFITPAKVAADKRFFEFSLCQTELVKFKDKFEAVKLKEKAQGDWTTRTT